MDVAIYWIEHVIKHNGARHLQHAGLKLSWFQYYLIDVIGFLIGIALVSLFVNCYIAKKIFSYIKRKIGQSKIKVD